MNDSRHVGMYSTSHTHRPNESEIHCSLNWKNFHKLQLCPTLLVVVWQCTTEPITAWMYNEVDVVVLHSNTTNQPEGAKEITKDLLSLWKALGLRDMPEFANGIIYWLYLSWTTISISMLNTSSDSMNDVLFNRDDYIMKHLLSRAIKHIVFAYTKCV